MGIPMPDIELVVLFSDATFEPGLNGWIIRFDAGTHDIQAFRLPDGDYAMTSRATEVYGTGESWFQAHSNLMRVLLRKE